MRNAPCMNASCKSYGKPHPNCKCHGSMAKGGVVELFCASNKPHKKECKYFAGGGEVQDDIIPDEEIVGDDDIIPDEEVIADSDKYGTLGQQALTAVEGAAQSVLGPLATMAEVATGKLFEPTVKFGVMPNIFTTKEDIAGRRKENPNIHIAGQAAGMIGSIATGTGAAALAARATEKIGSVFIKNALTSMAMTSSDEITKSLLGIGDPGAAASSIFASGILGGIGGAATKKAGEVFGKAFSSLAGESGKDLALGTDLQNFLKQAVVKYSNPHDLTLSNVTKSAIDGAKIGGLAGDINAIILGASAGAAKEVGRSIIGRTGKYTAPVLLRALGEAEGNILPKVTQLLNYAKDIEHGTKLISEGVNNFFVQPAAQSVAKKIQKKDADFEKMKKIVDEAIKGGGVNQNLQEQIYKDYTKEEELPGFAQGGIVAQKPTPIEKGQASPILENNDPVQRFFPTQNAMTQGGKIRVSNYLSQVRPSENPPMLPFDRKPNQKAQTKAYDKALTIAVNPLYVLDKIQKGRLTKDDMLHFNSMYPELKTHLQKQVSKRIVEAQVNGEKPNRHIKQSLSLFMGAPMESTLTQPMIAAAQATFKNSRTSENEAQPTKKKSASSLEKSSNQHKTMTDAGEARTQTSKL